MKKLISIAIAVSGIVFFSSMIMSDTSALPSRKDRKISKPISSSVMKIAERSCVKCHTDGGISKKALMRLNLSNWDKFMPLKQAKKAKRMCNYVSKGKMPPEGFVEKNPGTALTKDEVQIICDWAASNR